MSARIYQFPARGRFAADKCRDESEAQNFSAQRVAKAIFGNAWYHEEAVQSERTETNEKTT